MRTLLLCSNFTRPAARSTRVFQSCDYLSRSSIASARFLIVGVLTLGCSASVIVNLPSEDSLSSIGEPFSPYYAQTFVALAPGSASGLTVELSHDEGEDAMEFRVLVTGVSGYGATFHPTTILYESSIQVLDVGSSVTLVHVDLPNLQLHSGDRYAFVLDAFGTRDGASGSARAGTNSTYAGGEFYFNQGFGGDTRAEHFASDWLFAEEIYPPAFHDLAFEMHFVPEPSTAILALSGVAAGLQRRRSIVNASRTNES